MTTIRAALRILLTCAVLYLYWRFKEGAPAQLAFVAYVGALFVEQWAMARLRSKGPPAGTSGFDNRLPGRSRSDQDVEDGAAPAAFADYVSSLVVVLALLLMSDSFFFTDWLGFGSPDSGESGGLAFVKIVASLIALVAAFGGPVVAGVITYGDLADWISRRRPNASGFMADFGPAVPAAVVTIAFYGHFYVGYLVYSAMGVLRSG